MEKYNIDLRSKILVYSIRQEELSTEIVKKFIRIVKRDLKTLGNNSTNFSFKNKIDLLFDIGDLDKKQYPRFIKFMEIRNQFMHNPTCSTFLDLKSQNKEITNFLTTNFKNDIEDEEQSLFKSLAELNAFCEEVLIKLDKEYDEGITKEIHRFLAAKLENNFESLLSKTIDELTKSERFNKSDIGFIEFCFRCYRDEYIIDEINKVSKWETLEKDVFDRKR